jgi:hypothetical protein
MSRDGVAFGGGHGLPVGSFAELRIEWPVLQEAERPIGLHVTGLVVWSASGQTAVRLGSYRFLVYPAPGSDPRMVI